MRIIEPRLALFQAMTFAMIIETNELLKQSDSAPTIGLPNTLLLLVLKSCTSWCRAKSELWHRREFEKQFAYIEFALWETIACC